MLEKMKWNYDGYWYMAEYIIVFEMGILEDSIVCCSVRFLGIEVGKCRHSLFLHIEIKSEKGLRNLAGATNNKGWLGLDPELKSPSTSISFSKVSISYASLFISFNFIC